MFPATLVWLVSASIMATTSDGGKELPVSDIETKVTLSGQWLPAFQKALEKFREVKKDSLNCYEVTAYVERGRLVVYFYAAPKEYNSGVRGQPSACGKSITYFLNKDGEVIDMEYLR